MHLIKQQQPCVLTQFQKPELLEDTNSITLLHIFRPSPFPPLAFAAPLTSSAGSPRRVPSFCCSGEEIHHPGGGMAAGREVGDAACRGCSQPAWGLAGAAVCAADTLLLVVLDFILLR